MAEPVVVHRTISASAESVWALISDVTRMGQWSPETTSCKWVRGATGPTVGARFVGQNRHGKRRWATFCRVNDCIPGQTFGFLVAAGPVKIAQWTYTIESDGEHSCVVTESTVNLENRVVAKLGDLLTNTKNRAEHNRAGMLLTLERLAKVAEAA